MRKRTGGRLCSRVSFSGEAILPVKGAQRVNCYETELIIRKMLRHIVLYVGEGYREMERGRWAQDTQSRKTGANAGICGLSGGACRGQRKQEQGFESHDVERVVEVKDKGSLLPPSKGMGNDTRRKKFVDEMGLARR